MNLLFSFAGNGRPSSAVDSCFLAMLGQRTYGEDENEEEEEEHGKIWRRARPCVRNRKTRVGRLVFFVSLFHSLFFGILAADLSFPSLPFRPQAVLVALPSCICCVFYLRAVYKQSSANDTPKVSSILLV